MRVCSLVTCDTVAQARVLARSLRRHQPDWSLELVRVDRGEDVDGLFERAGEELVVRSAAELLDLELAPLIARHDERELTVLLLPSLLRAYTKLAPGPLIHLPPSVWVIGELAPVAEQLSAHGVLLVPRMRVDVPDDGLEPAPPQMEVVGRMEETIIGVDGSRRADGFLAWWGAHVEETIGALDVRHGGARPEDRPWLARFLELAPARFSTGLLDEPGYNLNAWNLHAHTLEGTPERVLVDGRWPGRFLHLPGFEPDRPHRLNARATRIRVSRSPLLRELCVTYAAELLESGWRDGDHRDQVGRRLAGGLIYDDRLRALHRRARALGERFDDLFGEEGGKAFVAWLDGPAPEGAAHGINRYLFYRVADERADVLRAYPDLDGDDGAGYVAWCWAFGREELSIPDRFMPPRAGSLPPPAADEGGATVAPAGAGATTTTVSRGAPAVAAAPGGSDLAVRMTGYLGHTLGLGSAARGYVRALGAAGVPVSTVSVPLHHLVRPEELTDEYGQHAFEDLLHDGRHGFELVAVNADELPGFVGRLGEGYFEGPRIGIWGWETNSIPPGWKRAFALVDEVWVYSAFMAENIGAVAPVPVVPLAPPVAPPATAATPVRLGIPEGFLFAFVFDYLSTIQRKNPVALVEAFKRAFAPGEGPRLLIKTINAPLRPLSAEELLWAAHGRPDIHVIDRSLSGEQLDGVMAACDCYVSLHRAEGFGLTMAEAMAIGKPVIATGYSGNLDFMDEHNSYLVDCAIARVGPENDIYPSDGEWAQPSVEHAAELMRRVYEDREGAARVGARARDDILRRLSPEATGAAMRARLEELNGRAG
jgi:glycosyltransferase involved in cell wall biosynthesis